MQQLILMLCLTVHDGSVIFLQGGPLTKPISKRTDSTLTHAAIVLYHGNEPWVYEASPPHVSRMPLADYLSLLEERRHGSWFLIEPRIPYSIHELAAMKRYADSQLGRPYALRGWWKDREVRGIFCSQYVGNIIDKSGRIVSAQFHESPGSLYRKLSVFYQLINADCLDYLHNSHEKWATCFADPLCGPPHNGSSVAQAVMWRPAQQRPWDADDSCWTPHNLCITTFAGTP